MIGVSEIIGFCGILLGFGIGLTLGGAHGWLIGIFAAFCGAILGGRAAYFWAYWFYEYFPARIRRFEKRRPRLAAILDWMHTLLVLIFLIGLLIALSVWMIPILRTMSHPES
jgi:membrane protein YqaA with SNARE-associated domain